MTVYRHYKNLPYRFLNIVKHSETQEELVLYETLYDNQGGRFWVRPKEMFFEDVTVAGGEKRARFAELRLEIKTSNALTPELSADIHRVGRLAFEDYDESQLSKRTADKKNVHVAVGYLDGKAVAFKIGYEQSQKTFYSWLGAVDPAYHRYGFAQSLARAQHEWCLGQSYDFIQTKCLNFNIAMLRLNLKFGFLVIDTELTEQGLKLILEKRIREHLA